MPKKQTKQSQMLSSTKGSVTPLPSWPPSKYVIVSRQLDGGVNVVVSWVIVVDGDMITSILEIESLTCQISRRGVL
jgi:hypothetical protein